MKNNNNFLNVNSNNDKNNNQVHLMIRPVKSRFSRASPISSPKRSANKRGRSVNSESGSVAD